MEVKVKLEIQDGNDWLLFADLNLQQVNCKSILWVSPKWSHQGKKAEKEDFPEGSERTCWFPWSARIRDRTMPGANGCVFREKLFAVFPKMTGAPSIPTLSTHGTRRTSFFNSPTGISGLLLLRRRTISGKLLAKQFRLYSIHAKKKALGKDTYIYIHRFSFFSRIRSELLYNNQK